MSLLKTIAEQAAQRKLRFVVIGGRALIFHGYDRQTFDLDLAVDRSERTEWAKLVGEMGYTIHNEGPTFWQFNPPPDTGEPLDIMLASDETLGKIIADAATEFVGNRAVNMASVPTLVALKCHSIKNGHAARVEKDVHDLIFLVVAKKLDLEDNYWRELILKYGTPEIYKKLKKASES